MIDDIHMVTYTEFPGYWGTQTSESCLNWETCGRARIGKAEQSCRSLSHINGGRRDSSGGRRP